MKSDREHWWEFPTIGSDPDRESWEYRFGYLSQKAMWAIGIPRPIRHLLAWPLLALVVIVHALVITPVRLIRRFAILSWW